MMGLLDVIVSRIKGGEICGLGGMIFGERGRLPMRSAMRIPMKNDTIIKKSNFLFI